MWYRVVFTTMYWLLLSVPTVSTVFAAEQMSGLQAALFAAVSNHPVVKGQRQSVLAKDYDVKAARAQRFPTLTASVASHNDNTDPIRLSARQPIWTFGRISSGIAYSNADLQVEKAGLLQVMRQIIDKTAAAYARVRGAYDQLAVGGANVTALEILYQQVKRRQQGKMASSSDVQLASARLLQARGQLIQLQGELAVRQAELLALTQSIVNDHEAIPEGVTQSTQVNELLTQALRQSADMQVRQEAIKRAEKEVARVRNAAMPTVYFQADRYYEQPAYVNGTRLGIVVEGSLDGLGLVSRSRTSAATANLQAMQLELEATRADIQRQVSSLWTTLQSQTYQVESLRDSESALLDTLASYQRQYESGRKSWQDVLNMQRELTEQRLRLVQAQSDRQIAALHLASLVGRLDQMAGL